MLKNKPIKIIANLADLYFYMYIDEPENLIFFNIHDLILLMTAGQYCLLAILIYFTRSHQRVSYLILVVILLLSAAQTIDTLILWSEGIRAALLRSHPNAFFWGSIGFWLQGPLLLWYVKSTLYKDFRFTGVDVLHFVPALLILTLLISFYYRLPSAEKYDNLIDMKFTWTSMMESIKSLRHIFIVTYAGSCLYILAQYRKKLALKFSNFELQERSWLTWIVSGVITMSTLSLVTHLTGNSISHEASNLLGLSCNYLNLVFANSLVFLHARYSHFFEGIDDVPEQANVEEYQQLQFKPENIQRIENCMCKNKLYLDSDITLESLAQRLSLPERTVSRIINHHFEKNFFEFINDYRVEEAKCFLADKDNGQSPVLEAMAASGFRSKSSFNAIFKKATGLTPTQYRKHQETIISQKNIKRDATENNGSADGATHRDRGGIAGCGSMRTADLHNDIDDHRSLLFDQEAALPDRVEIDPREPTIDSTRAG